MGIDPFMVSRSTLGVIAQRLARRLCQDCKEGYTPDDISLKYLGLDPTQQFTFYRNRGCDKCSSTGYRGRVGAYEVLRVSPDLRSLVAGGASSAEILELAVKNGMKTLKDYSVWLLQNGWTTMEEVLHVISVQE
jgi:type IV pilus assembly protein PilB